MYYINTESIVGPCNEACPNKLPAYSAGKSLEQNLRVFSVGTNEGGYCGTSYRD